MIEQINVTNRHKNLWESKKTVKRNLVSSS